MHFKNYKQIQIMKKLFFAVIIAAITMTSVNAQQFGARLGLNLSNVTGDYTQGTKMILGANGGAVVEFKLSDKFSFQPELLFSMEGVRKDYKENLLGTDIVYDTNSRVNYITLPLMAKYYVIDGLSVQLGPKVSYLLSAKVKGTIKTTTFGNETVTNMNENVKDNISDLDYGLNFGAGYKMENGFFVDARYYLGLANINDQANVTATQKNTTISISVGYYFN